MLEALVVCVVSLNAAALRPAARLVALPSRPRSAVSARLAVSLPGFGGGSASGGDSGPSEESVQYYRLLGVGEDATYDDVNSKYDELAARYVDDPKMTIKLQVAKDKIFDDKLRQRLSGRTVSGVKDPFENLGNEKKPLITLPPFLDSVMELPSRSALLENAAVFGAIGLLPMLSKGWASSSVGIGFAVGLYKLYNRGVPQSSGMGAEMRPPKVKPVALAAGITLLAGAIGATLSQFVYALFRAVLTAEAVIGLCISGSFFVSSTFFKVQDEY